MSKLDPVAELRRRVGCEVVIEGVRWRLHDVLTDSSKLVFTDADGERPVQVDGHGNPRRRTAHYVEKPIRGRDGQLTAIAEALLASASTD
jgi:hypothetical protein